MKIFRTFLIIGSVLCTIILWATRHEWQNSLSAFASSQNVVWYNLMHIMAVSFFFINGAAKNRINKYTNGIRHGFLDYVVAMGMGLILVTNMYVAYTWHVIFTASTLAIALFNIIFTAPKVELGYRWVLTGIAVTAFLVGYITEFHFLVGEVIAMACVAVAMVRQIWKYD